MLLQLLIDWKDEKLTHPHLQGMSHTTNMVRLSALLKREKI